MSRITDKPAQGTLFMTSAGGGAPLYPIRERDYLANIKSVHHFTLFDFDGDQVTITPIDINGKEFDRYILKKQPTPPEELCSYEVEELKDFLRRALAAAPATVVSGSKPTSIDAALEVPSRFQIPMTGKLRWEPADGWFFRATEAPFKLEPKELLKLPLQAMVEPKGLGASPKLTIEFDAGRFRNRTIELYPFKLTSPATVPVSRVARVTVDGVLDDNAWQKVEPLHLLPTTPGSKARPGDHVQLATDGQALFVAAVLADPEHQVKVVPSNTAQEPSRLVVSSSEHVRVELSDGKESWLFAISSENIPYHTVDSVQTNRSWRAQAAGAAGSWSAELAIPLEIFSDPKKLKLNIVHRVAATGQEYELRPTFDLGPSPDLIPDWKAALKPDRFAVVEWP
jgi:hypothetical protein